MIVVSVIPYGALILAFAVGVWAATGRKLTRRITAAMLTTFAVTGLVTPLFFQAATREALAAHGNLAQRLAHPLDGSGGHLHPAGNRRWGAPARQEVSVVLVCDHPHYDGVRRRDLRAGVANRGQPADTLAGD